MKERKKISKKKLVIFLVVIFIICLVAFLSLPDTENLKPIYPIDNLTINNSENVTENNTYLNDSEVNLNE